MNVTIIWQPGIIIKMTTEKCCDGSSPPTCKNMRPAKSIVNDVRSNKSDGGGRGGLGGHGGKEC